MKLTFTKTIYILPLLLLSAFAYAGGGTIRGTVKDSASASTIPGILVIANNTNITTTDAFGNFRFSSLEAGRYELKFSYMSFKPQTQVVNIGNDEDKKIDINLRSSAISLSEVSVYSGVNLDQNITTFNQVDKELRPVNSAQDLYRLVPGLFIAQHAGGGKAEQIFLRGFDCDHGTDFAVSIDGIPVNMVSHAHGQGYADFHFVIPETVDELKVYKGPYNAKFGDFATSGAGEFLTKNYIAKNEVKLEYGMFDTYRVFTMLDLLGTKHLLSKRKESAYVAAEYFYTNSYFDAAQHFNRFNIFAKYNGMLSERTSLSFSASTFNSNWDASGQVPQRAVDAGIISRFGSVDNSEGGRTDRTNVNLTLTRSARNNDIIKNQVYFVNYHFNLFSNFTFFLNDPINGDEINQTERGRNIYGYTGTYEHRSLLAGRNLKTTLGWGTRIDDGEISLRHAVKRVILDTLVLGRLTEANLNIYLDETLELTKKLSLNAGLRLDHFEFRFNNYLVDSLTGHTSKTRLSPKLNLYYTLNPSVQFFIHSGIGFHSNDARAVVANVTQNTLPKAYGAEIGTTLKAGKNVLVHAALWGLDLEQELVYAGDDGTVSINGATRRVGIDFAVRVQLAKYIFADVDVNANRGRFKDLPTGENYIPLAPSLTSTGGLTYKREKGFNAALRYRYIDSRPANEDNSVVAKGYFLVDALVNYTQKRYQIGLSAENILNVKWNQAQFDTESRLQNEAASVSELHFTPGTPFFLKGTVSFYF